MITRFRVPALIALGILLEVTFLALVREPGTPVFPFLTWMVAAGLFYLIAVAWVLRAGSGPLPAGASPLSAGARPLSKSGYRFLLLAAVAFRLTLLPLTPSLSHQIERFHWDGKIQQSGFNPYQYPPESPLLSPIRTPTDRLAPAPAIAAYHPPLAELLFHWNFELFGGLRRQKLLFVGLDLLLLGLLVRMLKARGLPRDWIIVYAWSPLAVFEIAGNGHMESAAGLLALLALHWAGRRPRWSAVAIASACLAQWYAAVLLPTVLAAARRKWLGAAAWLAGVAVFWTLPYLWINKHVALGAIAANVRAHAVALPLLNGSLFPIARAWFGAHVAAALAVAVVGAAIGAAWVRGLEPLRAGFFILGALLLVMPQVQPWYLLWLLPLLVFWPEAPWLYFAAAVPLAYGLPRHPWLVWVEYVPVFALLLWQARPAALRPRRA